MIKLTISDWAPSLLRILSCDGVSFGELERGSIPECGGVYLITERAGTGEEKPLYVGQPEIFGGEYTATTFTVMKKVVS
jgi:hypothetical protein